MAMIIDGKIIAERIKNELKGKLILIKKELRLAIIEAGASEASRKFLEQKIKFADGLGIETKEYKFSLDISTTKFRKELKKIVHLKKNSGVIIQLPLPEQINVQYILNAIPPEKDIDVLSSRAIGDFATGRGKISPPVVEALKEVFKEYKIDLNGKKVAIVGRGKLVGKPLALWFLSQPVILTVAGSEAGKGLGEITSQADILISGVGKPNLISGEMLKKGAICLDFGTSESEGKLAGDFDFESAKEKAGLLSPVPGGLGPIVVACVFKNLVSLNSKF
ncbi:MAG: hypothetical protein A3H02_03005 [Candidatus Niyogibacteria bacterium RIFCSPLOWO2_12_FULL_41_13]|uniref:Bifunctional protein FolD n=1 Tax=Candidatus Niyogibacteria bacterium RIFCSPLOWO2_12_FULL_41_13 TaxID=1801726 RepID=A0A1G2F503_9BACT|nr:MAG: hypothetical protein A3H02_03005 [Candidatus Niyogibacteria bacterium RIFCSPLOWO2_12_FULL_41_13]